MNDPERSVLHCLILTYARKFFNHMRGESAPMVNWRDYTERVWYLEGTNSDLLRAALRVRSDVFTLNRVNRSVYRSAHVFRAFGTVVKDLTTWEPPGSLELCQYWACSRTA